MEISLCFFILSNIMTTVYVVYCVSRISVQQKHISSVFDEIIKHYSKNGDCVSNNLYVVGIKSYLHNTITVCGVFPNDLYALNYRNVFFPKADIFIVPYQSLKADSEGLSIPFASVKIK